MKKMELFFWCLLAAVSAVGTVISVHKIKECLTPTKSNEKKSEHQTLKDSINHQTEASTINITGDYINGGQTKNEHILKESKKEQPIINNGNMNSGNVGGDLHQTINNYNENPQRTITNEDLDLIKSIPVGYTISFNYVDSKETTAYADQLYRNLISIGHQENKIEIGKIGVLAGVRLNEGQHFIFEINTESNTAKILIPNQD